MYQNCEHAEVYRDSDGYVEEAFCRLGYLTCGACEDYTPPLWDVVDDSDVVDLGLPPF